MEEWIANAQDVSRERRDNRDFTVSVLLHGVEVARMRAELARPETSPHTSMRTLMKLLVREALDARERARAIETAAEGMADRARLLKPLIDTGVELLARSSG